MKPPGGNQVFTALVLARIIEPTSKFDSLRVLGKAGISALSYPTVKRHLPAFAADDFREALSAVCADHAGLGPGVLVLYDVATLYFETDVADEFRYPAFQGVAAGATDHRRSAR